MRQKPELLAPAGDMERLKMAVLYGADAVYLAGTDFGMRAFAGNFTPEELREVEAFVNEAIQADVAVSCEEMTVEEAKASGAIGLFESRYGAKVKVYTVPGYSKEICGGPHVQHTGQLGRFKIKKEEASSAGVRRIKAVLIHE